MGTCYACDEVAVGQTDHNQERVAACKRHSDPTMPRLNACIYCESTVRSGGVYVGLYGVQNHAHVKCVRQASN